MAATEGTTIEQIYNVMRTWAPEALAESWDNVGVLVRGGKGVTGVLCTLDITPAAVREAKRLGCSVIVSHHPVIYHPLRSIAADDVPALLLAQQMTAICMHTNLDKTEGGVSETLAEAIGLTALAPFADGLGRVGALLEPLSAAALAAAVSKTLGSAVKFVDGGELIARAAVVGGGGGEFALKAQEAGAQCLVTGEANHHHALDAQLHGVSLIAAGHFGTEAGIVPVIARRLREALPDVAVYENTAQADPFCYLAARA